MGSPLVRDGLDVDVVQDVGVARWGKPFSVPVAVVGNEVAEVEEHTPTARRGPPRAGGDGPRASSASGDREQRGAAQGGGGREVGDEEEVAEGGVVEHEVVEGKEVVVEEGAEPRGPQPGQPTPVCPSPSTRPVFPAAALAVQGALWGARRGVAVPGDAQSPGFVTGAGGEAPR